MLDHYKWIFVLVIACILINAVTSVIGATFPQTLVDDYIEPMLSTGANLFPELFNDIIELICIMAAGIMAAYCYSRLMVNVSQGTMLLLRNELFSKMESLPIKYFDTHAHGDIMSVYTNDIDTLRQLISQVIPQNHQLGHHHDSHAHHHAGAQPGPDRHKHTHRRAHALRHG